MLHASSPSAPPKLDISHASSPSMPPPPIIAPAAPGAYQYGAAGPSPVGSPATKAHQANLMDEIGNSYVVSNECECVAEIDAMGLTGLCIYVRSIKATNSTTILRIMRTVNLLLATATIAVGLLAWIMGYVSSFQKVIAGIYIMYVAASSGSTVTCTA